MLCRCRLLAALLLLAAPLLLRAAGTADITALQTSVDNVRHEVIFTGRASLSDGDTLLQADEIRYQYLTGTAFATGHVCLTHGTSRILAQSVVYHRATHSYEAQSVRFGRYPYYIAGRNAEGSDQRIVVYDARLSAGEPGPAKPTVSAASLTYLPAKNEISAQSPHLGLGAWQPISLPHFSHRLNLPLVSYVSVSAGYRSSLGAFGIFGLHLPFGTQNTSLGGDIGVYTARGVMVGPSAHYDWENNGLRATGGLTSGFIQDHGNRSTDILGRPVPEDRGYVQWWHSQDLSEHLSLTAQLNYWADSAILRDFKPDDFFRVQAPDNYIQAVYSGVNYYATAFLRADPNNFETVQQRLPEVRFDLMPTALGRGVYEQFSASAAVLEESPPGNSGPTLRTDRLDAYYALTRPYAPVSWFTFTPVVGGRVTHYTRTLGDQGDYTRLLGEFGFDAVLRSSAVFDYNNEAWGIHGIRHLLTPTLGYRYIPGATEGRAYIPPIDARTFGTYLPPLGLGDTRNIDDLAPTNVLRLGLNNLWQTRDDQYGSRDLLSFDLANDFHFSREPGQPAASDLQAMLALTPAPWVTFSLYQRLDTRTLEVDETNTGLTLRDGDAWQLQFFSNFLRNQIQEDVLQARLRLNEVYDVSALIDYDHRLHRFNEQSLALHQNLGNTWDIEYRLTLYNGPRRESNFGFRMAVNMFSF